MRRRRVSFGAAILKRIINGCEVDWASERVFAWLQDYPTYGYLFEVCADRKRIVRCVHISSTDEESDNTYEDARRFERDARQAVEEFLRQERDGPRPMGAHATRSSRRIENATNLSSCRPHELFKPGFGV